MATLQCMVHEAGRISRHRPAFLGTDIRILHGEFDLMVSATAMLLRAAGVKSGQRVALYMESGWAYATLLFALIRVGAVVCPLSTRLPVKGVKQHLDVIDCHTLIARVSEPSQAVLTGVTTLDPDGMVSRELTSGQIDDDFRIDLDQPAIIVFTSGSSGSPKAVQLTYGNLYYSAYGANQVIRLQSEDCWLLSLPLYHVGGIGILFRCLQSGAAVAVPDPDKSLTDTLPEFPVTHLSLVSTQLRRLLAGALPEDVVKRLKAVVLGGDDAADSLIAEARRRQLPVLRTYGLSEMSAMVTACAPTDPARQWTTCGRPLNYREIALAADGEILVRGATRFSGYVQGQTLVKPFDETGWFRTGDIGTIDDEGCLRIQGRKDNMFISGGENIHPEMIEAALVAIPGIQRAIVRPRPDAEYGQRPVAFVDADSPWNESDLIAHLRNGLPAFMAPVAIHPWPESLQGQPETLKLDRAAFDDYL